MLGAGGRSPHGVPAPYTMGAMADQDTPGAGSGGHPEGPHRILIVDSDPQVRSDIRAALSAEFFVVGEADNHEDAAALAKQYQPALVILNADVPGTPQHTATALILKAYPPTIVVILAARAEMHRLKRALEAGARDYIPKPFHAEELLAALKGTLERTVQYRVIRKQQRQLPGSGIWAFSRATGGVGQTTLLLAMAAELARMDRRVVVLDAHPCYGHVAFYLGLRQRSGTIADLAELPEATTRGTLGELTIQHPSGIRVVTAPADLIQGHTLPLANLAARVVDMADLVDDVLVDLPAGVPDDLIPILDSARHIFPVSNGSYSALLSLRDQLELFGQLGFQKDVLYPVLTGFRAGEEAKGLVEKPDIPPVRLLPFDPDSTARATLLGQPVTQALPECPYSQAVQEFVAELLTVKGGWIAAPARKSLLSRVFGKFMGS